MSEIKRLVVGDTTEAVIRVLFDNRIAQESTNDSLNNINRALKIKDLKNQIMSFIKRNHNSVFELVVPEYKSDKKVNINFTNFSDYDPDETLNLNNYVISINDSFIDAEITHRVKVGKDIVLKIKAD